MFLLCIHSYKGKRLKQKKSKYNPNDNLATRKFVKEGFVINHFHQ